MSSNTVAETAQLAELLARVAELEQRLAESERLRAEESRYRTIVETIPLGVTFMRLSDRSFVEFNDAAAHNIGYTRAEFAGLTIDDLRVSPEPDLHKRALTQIPETFEIKIRAKNGTVRDFVVAAYPVELEGELVICAISQDITERKRVEGLLWQQLSIIEAITTVASDAVFMTDGERRLTLANPAAERTFGFTFDELRGNGMHAMLHHTRADGSPYPVSECPLANVHKMGRGLQDHRDVFFHKNGTPVYVSVAFSPLIRDGRTIAVVSIVRDVTETERARRELTETNERLASALATAELGVWSANFATGEAFWDTKMKSFFGLAPDEHVTVATAEEFIHPDDRGSSWEILHSRPEADGDVQWEWRVIPRNGEIRWHQARGHVNRDETGRVVSAHGVTRDITDQRHGKEVRERLAAIVESTDDAIGSATLEGIITSWNRGAQSLYGYAPAEIVGCSAAVLIPCERMGELSMFLARIARGEAIEHHETERLTKDGRRIVVSITLSPMRNEAGQVVGVSSVTRDITREKLLEEKLRQAEKMEAIGQLAGGVAHDFNNLLTIVNGYAEMALTIATDELLREQLSAIQAAGQRATALTGQLLAFSRKQMLQPRIVNMNAVVEAMYPLLRRVIRKDIECVMELDPALSSVKADLVQMEQVLLNLVVNASDAMVSGGRILIETKDALLDEQYSQMHPDAAPGKYVMLAVSDTGAGMDPGVLARIFDPFFTTKPVGKGTGLGLSMVYGVTRQSGGHVTCHSDPGVGTRFRVYLPASGDAPAPNYLSQKLRPEAFRGTETILLAEDDPVVRTYAARLLRGLGYSIHEAADGEAAIVLGEKNRETIDLLITDMVMPGMGGRELAAVLRPLSSRMRVLYVSGYTDEAIVGNSMGSAFLPKPYSPQQLARKVREVLRA